MTVLAPPRHPLVDAALTDAKLWCAGRVIDDRPALAHAARVAVTIGRHQPHAAPDIIAAALVHDAPEFASPADLDSYLPARFGHEVHRLVSAMQAEHDALDRGQPVIPDPADQALMLLSTSDKVVALTSLLRRARLSGSVTGFFAARQPLLALLDHFRACQLVALDAVPDSLSAALARILDALDVATAPVRR